MLMLRRGCAVLLAVGGLAGAYLIDPGHALDSADAVALVAAVPLGCAALAFALWCDWRAPEARAPRPGGIAKSVRVAATRLAGAALMAVTLAPKSEAETAADRAACLPSVLRLCPREALSGDREAAKRCLLANLDRASTRCQVVVRGAPIASAAAWSRPPS